MKKGWIILLAAILALTAIACGTDRATGTQTETPAPVQTEEAAATDPYLGEWSVSDWGIEDDTLYPLGMRWDSDLSFRRNGAGIAKRWDGLQGCYLYSAIRFTSENGTIAVYGESGDRWTASYDPDSDEILLTADGTGTILLRRLLPPPEESEPEEYVPWFSAEQGLSGSWEIASFEGGDEEAIRALEAMAPVFTFFGNHTGRLSPRTTVYQPVRVFSFYTSGYTYEFSIVDEYGRDTQGTYDPNTNTIRMELYGAVFVLRPVPSDVTEEYRDPSVDGPDLHEADAELFMTESAVDSVAITALIPAQATLRIILPHHGDYVRTNEYEQDVVIRFGLPVGYFFPDDEHTEDEYRFTPEVTVTLRDGTEYALNCPTLSYYFPTLSLYMESEGEWNAEETVFTAAADASGDYRLKGHLCFEGETLLVDGEPAELGQGGTFSVCLHTDGDNPTICELRVKAYAHVTAVYTVVVKP